MMVTARRVHVLAIGMSALAGYVDALGYIRLGGYFVAFMSGNSTRFAIGIGTDRAALLTAGALVALFVAGVILGAAATRHAGRQRAAATLAIVAILLAVAIACDATGHPAFALGALTIAMGAENIAFVRDGEASIGLTYVTGTLVKIGLQLVAAFTGGERWGWMWPLWQWTGLVAGATAGAFAFRAFGPDAVWIALAFASLLAIVAWFAAPLGESTA